MSHRPSTDEAQPDYSQLESIGPLTADNIAEARTAISAFLVASSRPCRPDIDIDDTAAGGVPVRLYRPIGTNNPLPLHLYLHGGAFIFGSAFDGSLDADLADRAIESHCLVASVEYRLAPEYRFPTGIEDSYAALGALVEEADELGIDPTRTSVGGASAGGNFAAAVALLAQSRRSPVIGFQLLEMAGTDLTKSSNAWRNPAPDHDTTREADLALIDLYLSSVAQRADPLASPLFSPELSGAAPALFMNGELDPRRDECEAYAARLSDAGVPVVTATFAGVTHGGITAEWRAYANAALGAFHRGEQLVSR
ncbi:alpha/beta hydrolase [Diaminobutyricibacter tongyongensis]|uniref:Alpha/beta hydrolase n=1 Tax=Leifsonia tongyongensis TaxID=1268043 RepID=A0A6L9XVC1_9MICO|nr:alpha/beta hydrolase [Diaminobutyricibacter tongyongensis]NEN05359.1 alpha/beta hydrolase [Diaminobutyricibacter tongyongensis]